MATRPLLEPAACPVFAPYIEELHEFLATDGLPFGSPADLAAVTDRLRQRGPFSDDLSSLVRSWVLREGGAGERESERGRERGDEVERRASALYQR